MENIEEKIKNLLAEYEDYAKANGFKVNPNKQIAEGIVRALLMKQESFNERYCPCRKMTGDKEEDKKIICPCIYHKEEIEKDGHCHCNLFVK
jgi:ferredoxin-thioredoxin reductase catalytic chain